MKRKIYKFISDTKQYLFAVSLFAGCASIQAQTTYTFNYTGSSQTISLPAGNYSIECWGADGGKGFQTSQIANNGKGGYSYGILNLPSAQTITVYVGGAGTNADGTTVGQVCAGGFNGGGSSGANNYVTTASYRAGGGGGASDVRVGGSALTDRVIVAGGGGGGVYSTTYPGGNGGGLSGGNGGNTYNGGGGSQTAGGVANGSTGNIAGTAGALGVGGNGGTATSKSGGGGGGGGYYGGGGGATGNSSSSQGGGGGGSGYIGGVTSGTTIMTGQSGFVTNPDVTGNGLVLIKELCSISLMVSGLNASGAICAGNSVTLTTNAINNYSWSTGATTSSLVLSPASNIVVSLSALSTSSCTANASATILVSSGMPTVNAVNSTAGNGFGVCPNNAAILTGSGAISYSWTGGISNAVSFTPATSQSYTLTGENGCGTSSAVTSVSIHPTPTVSAIGVTSPTMCTGISNTLSASGSGPTSYLWSTGTTSTSIIVSPTGNTTYTVTGTSAEGCTNTAVTTITVVTTPTQVPVASPAVICLGESSTLTATGTTFNWLPGGSTNGVLVVTPVASGVSVYTVTKANANCSDTKTLSVTVNTVPVISALASPTVVCAGVESATLTGAGGTSYTWSPSVGNSNTVVVSAIANTVYTVTGSDGNCSNTNTVLLSVNPLPVILPTASSPSICLGEFVTLSASGADSYTWNPGGPFPFMTVYPTANTLYNVVGTNSLGCNNSATISVAVFPVPIVNVANFNPVVCDGSPAIITASGADTYSWSNNTTANSVTVVPQFNTTYSVTGTYTLSNCSTTETVQVNIFTPTVAVSGNSVICEGKTATLSATAAGAISYSWSTGLPIQTIYASPTVNTTYYVSALVSGSNIACTAVNNIQVTVNQNPSVFPVADNSTVCVKESANITVSGAVSYAWTWGTQSSNASSIVITPSVNTTIIVFVTGTDANGCSSTGTLQLVADACTGLEKIAYSDRLQIYPNPSQGEIHLQFDRATDLEIITVTGQTVHKISLNEDNGFTTNLSGLSNGIYFVRGQYGTETFSKKIVVNK